MNLIMKIATFPVLSFGKIFKIFSIQGNNDFRKVDEVLAFQEQARQIRLLNTPFL